MKTRPWPSRLYLPVRQEDTVEILGTRDVAQELQERCKHLNQTVQSRWFAGARIDECLPRTNVKLGSCQSSFIVERCVLICCVDPTLELIGDRPPYPQRHLESGKA